ncbi:16S rRNA m(2)G966-methyltransferase [compost metagenome]
MFLDPPYSLNLWDELAQKADQYLSDQALIYVEADRGLNQLNLPSTWQLQKQTKAGVVQAGLFKKII